MALKGNEFWEVTGVVNGMPSGVTELASVSDVASYANTQAASQLYTGAAMTFFGDSITVGVGATTTAKSYVGLIGAATGSTITNSGYSGSTIVNQVIATIAPLTSATGKVYGWLSGYNTARQYGTSTAGQATYQASLLSGLLWLAHPYANKIPGVTPVSQTGTWAGGNIYSGAMATLGTYFTTVNASTLTYTVNGSAIYIGYTNRKGAGGTAGGTFNVSVDGVAMRFVDTDAGVEPIDTPQSFWPEAIRIGGLAEGPHTVVITANITGSQAVNIDWLAGNGDLKGASMPIVYLGDTLRMNAAGYAASSPNFSNATDAVMESFNAMNRRTAAALAGDGFNVIYVDASRYYNPNDAAQIGPDNVHPTDAGHAQIAQSFLAGMSRLPLQSDIEAARFAGQLRSQVHQNAYKISIGNSPVESPAKFSILETVGSGNIEFGNAAGSTYMRTYDRYSSAYKPWLLYTYSDTNATLFCDQNGRVGLGLTGAAARGRLEITQLADTSADGYALTNAAVTASARLFIDGSGQVNLSNGTNGTSTVVINPGGGGVQMPGAVVMGGTSINANAQLDVQSTTKAFMPPRMTTTQKNAIASPTSGMVVYDSTLNKLSVRGASAWETITSV